MTRAEEIDAFFKSGDCVCPFARVCVNHYVEVAHVPRFGRPTLLRAVRAFSSTEGKAPPHTLVLVSASNTVDSYDDAKEWCRRAFLELLTCTALVSGHDPEAVAGAVEAAEPILMNDADARRPHAALLDSALVTIGLSATYPVGHVRYAPHTALVVTWASDVSRGQTPEMVINMRKEMIARHGKFYDADELVLALPTKVQLKGKR